jgi:lipopolysaccharide export system permease protein
MLTLDRYVLRETAKPLAYALGIVLTALLLERLIRLVDMMLSKGGPVILVVQMIASLVPHYMGLALPAAFYVSVLLAIARFGSDSELDAMQATGISLPRLMAPIFALAVVLAAGSIALMGFIQPYSRYAYRAAVYALTHAAWDTRLQQGVFVTDSGRMTITADRIDAGGLQLTGVFVHQEMKSGESVTTTARAGALVRSPDGGKRSLQLTDGVQLRWDPLQGRSGSLDFARITLPLETIVPEPFRDRGGSERELTLQELWEVRKAPPEGISPTEINAELHARLARSLSLLLLPFLAVPLGLTAKRARRSYGLAVAGILLLAYDHVLQFGYGFVELGRLPPLVGLWLPFSLFGAASLALFWRVSAFPGANPIDSLIGGIADRLAALGRAAWRRPAAQAS